MGSDEEWLERKLQTAGHGNFILFRADVRALSKTDAIANIKAKGTLKGGSPDTVYRAVKAILDRRMEREAIEAIANSSNNQEAMEEARRILGIAK